MKTIVTITEVLQDCLDGLAKVITIELFKLEFSINDNSSISLHATVFYSLPGQEIKNFTHRIYDYSDSVNIAYLLEQCISECQIIVDKFKDNSKNAITVD